MKYILVEFERELKEFRIANDNTLEGEENKGLRSLFG